jgi:isoleucyl-tRNA synthetase
MNSSFTKSVWWGFGELYKKGLVYESFKVMHVSPLLETTLSNFEVNQAYKDITDISATVKFELIDQPNTFVLAWTTTPWTLPGNVALAVGNEIMYVKIKVEDVYYILAKDLVEKNFKDKEFEIIEELFGRELVGKSYKAVFEYYSNDKSLENYSNGWKIYPANFVTTTDGTGVVHIAPAFGEDDLNLAKECNLPFVQHVKMNGQIKEEITELAGRQAKPKHDPQETDIEVIKLLAHQGSLFAKEKYIHSYPHCWRTDAPLLNYATSSWFIKVTAIKDQLVKNNESITWIPEVVGTGRFGNWLKEARDWAISRSRFWGTPIPIWKSEDGKEVEVLSSLEDIQAKTKSTNTFFVLRHGEAEHNLSQTTSDTDEVPSHLTQKGKEDIIQIAQNFKNKKIDLVFVSPLMRAQETADILKRECGLSDAQIITDKRIKEVQTGVNGKSNDEYKNFFKNFEDRYEQKHPQGESLIDIKKRVGDFMYEINSKYSNKTILIVSHEYPIWMLMALKDGLEKQETLALKNEGEFLKTGDIQVLEFAPIPHNDEYELDFHRPYIDEITFVQNGKTYKRIEDVFDGWIDSGAMPFASAEYPESKDVFKPGNFLFKGKGFPADFIAEGLDQTRGWFYTLLVWSTALFGKTSFKHVVVNGLVLAEDGKKMSKSLNNYPPLEDTLHTYGADALRYFLMSSPAVKSDDIRFSEKGVDEVMKKIVMRLDNVISFYEMYKDDSVLPSSESSHILDKWILARLAQTTIEITKGFEGYELDKASRPLMDFVDDLSTWYLRRSRDRLKSEVEDKSLALATLRYVLREFAKVMAPIMPFKAEDTYLRTKISNDLESVHLCVWPQVKTFDESVLVGMKEVRDIVTKALEIRAKESIKVRQPIQTLETKVEINSEYAEIIKDEVNVKDIEINTELETDVWLDTTITPELKKEGDARELIRSIQDLRKNTGLSQEDTVVLHIVCDADFKNIVEQYTDLIQLVTRTQEIIFIDELPGGEITVNEFRIKIVVQKVE